MAPHKVPVASKTSTIAKVQNSQPTAGLPQTNLNPAAPKSPVQKLSYSFTQSQLALALSIQKSKPADVSTRDYIIQIQQNVKLGRKADHGETRYIDSAEFWKSQYTKLYSEKLQLEEEVCILERLNKQHPSMEKAQNKAGEITLAGASRSHKRKSPPSLQKAINDLVDLQSTPVADISSASCTIPYLPLLKHAQVLHRLLQDNKVSTDTLLASLQSSISYMALVVTSTLERIKAMDQSAQESWLRNVYEAFAVVAAVFKTCLQGLAYLCRDITGRRCKGQVVYALVKLFDTFLQNINDLCQRPKESDMAVVRYTQARLRPRIEQTSQCNHKFTFLSPFAKLLVDVLLCPELLDANCSPVLEGVLCAILTRIGHLISETVFSERIASSTMPGGISSPQSPNASPERDRAIQLEAQCLAWVLDRALGQRDEKERNAIMVLIMGQKPSQTSPTNGAVLSKAKRRLQDTLLTGVFGSVGDDFMTALKRPEATGEEWGCEAAAFERDVPQSFVESIWSTIGWEFLGS